MTDIRPATDEEIAAHRDAGAAWCDELGFSSLLARIDADRQEIERLRAEGALLREALEICQKLECWRLTITISSNASDGIRHGEHCLGCGGWRYDDGPEIAHEPNCVHSIVRSALAGTALVSAHLERVRALVEAARRVPFSDSESCPEWMFDLGCALAVLDAGEEAPCPET